MKGAMSKAYELIETQSYEAACDGGAGGLGHPRVFLKIDPEKGEITCPYCSRTYRHKRPHARSALKTH
jgi:uncharacterized Zn-finger protein